MGKLGQVGFLLLLAMSSRMAGAADDFPYTATITAGEVYVRSGPGKDYYPTDKLKKGQKVEVYRHDPGGWCAIRPPKESFSWVSARQLELLGDGLARAKGDRVVSRVGSAFSDIRDVIQVRLKKGEQVELVERNAPHDTQWHKIHPPSGEFRWISSRFLESNDPTRGRRTVQIEAGDDQEEDLAETDAPRRLRDLDDGDEPTERGNRDIQLASREEPELDGPAWQRRTRQSGPSSRTGTTSELLYPLSKEVHSIDLELSAMVAEEITAWSFERIRQRAERALDVAETAVERGNIRNLVSKIERFEELKRRHDAVAGARAETDRRERTLNPAASIAISDNAPRFDGSGRLTPVVSTKVGAPQYALVDERGAVSVFLSAAPGVNLRSYVDKQIGVNGPRGFIPDLQKQHINVQRVTMLDSAR